MIEGVKSLLPAHYIIFDLKSRNFIQKKYWDAILNRSDSSVPNALIKKLEEVVKLHLVSDVPVGAYLSGGLDSSSVVALMSEYNENIKTFSVHYGMDWHGDERKYAHLVAETFNTDHHDVLVDQDKLYNLPEILCYLDECIFIETIIPSYYLAEYARKYVKVVITGNGGDEVFCGYGRYSMLSKLEMLSPFLKKFHLQYLRTFIHCLINMSTCLWRINIYTQ